MKQLSALFATALIALIFACGGTEKASDTPAPTRGDNANKASAGGDGLYDACKAAMEKSRACTDEYIPALVGVRVELDYPAGIKATDDSEGRDALVAKAHEEWKGDSTDEAIAEACKKVDAQVPADHREKNINTSNECAAKDACGDYVACIMPLHKEMFQVAASMQAGQ